MQYNNPSLFQVNICKPCSPSKALKDLNFPFLVSNLPYSTSSDTILKVSIPDRPDTKQLKAAFGRDNITIGILK